MQIPVAVRAFHWQPVRNTKKIASIAARSGTRGLWQPSGWRGRGGNSGSIRSQRSSGMRQPSSATAGRWPAWLLSVNIPERWGSDSPMTPHRSPTEIDSKVSRARSVERRLCRATEAAVFVIRLVTA